VQKKASPSYLFELELVRVAADLAVRLVQQVLGILGLGEGVVELGAQAGDVTLELALVGGQVGVEGAELADALAGLVQLLLGGFARTLVVLQRRPEISKLKKKQKPKKKLGPTLTLTTQPHQKIRF